MFCFWVPLCVSCKSLIFMCVQSTFSDVYQVYYHRCPMILWFLPLTADWERTSTSGGVLCHQQTGLFWLVLHGEFSLNLEPHIHACMCTHWHMQISSCRLCVMFYLWLMCFTAEENDFQQTFNKPYFSRFFYVHFPEKVFPSFLSLWC